jgi:lambda repressor-like predicted transcriptional regulator
VEQSGMNKSSSCTAECHCPYKRKRSAAYNAWINMRQRCSNPKRSDYVNYGGRGVRVCSRWDSFDQFYIDMGDPPDGSSLDRIDVNGDYEPSKCRWASRIVQSDNRRNTVNLTCAGKTQSLRAWAAETGLDIHTLRVRYLRGWPAERILSHQTRATATEVFAERLA